MNNFARMFFRGRKYAAKSPTTKASKPKPKRMQTDEGAFLPSEDEIAQRARAIRQAKGIQDED